MKNNAARIDRIAAPGSDPRFRPWNFRRPGMLALFRARFNRAAPKLDYGRKTPV